MTIAADDNDDDDDNLPCISYDIIRWNPTVLSWVVKKQRGYEFTEGSNNWRKRSIVRPFLKS